MKPNYKPNLTNRPPHIYKDNGLYFITCRTVEGQWFLQPDKYKQILLDILSAKSKKFSFSLIAYAILQNHYHAIFDIKAGNQLAKFIREINGASAREINKADHVIERKIWWNYFDTPLLNEAEFFCHLNYIHQNSIKHGITKDFEYAFSSYNSWVKKKGKGYLDQSFEKYPVIDFKVLNDEF